MKIETDPYSNIKHIDIDHFRPTKSKIQNPKSKTKQNKNRKPKLRHQNSQIFKQQEERRAMLYCLSAPQLSTGTLSYPIHLTHPYPANNY